MRGSPRPRATGPRRSVAGRCSAVISRTSRSVSLPALAMDRFSDDREIAIERARTAEHLGDWAAALCRWELVRDRFPDEPAGYCGAAQALLRLGRVVEAEALLVEAMRRLPAIPEP